MHVHDHVHPELSSPVNYLRDAVDVGGVEPPALGLEQAPRDRQPDRVEAETRHRLEVFPAQRWILACARIRRTLAILVGGRFEGKDRTAAWAELEQRGRDRSLQQDHAALFVCDVRRRP